MTREDIDDAVCAILKHDGPDGHIDGHDTLTDLIVAIECQEGEEWAANYYEKKGIKCCDY